jgi:hypothetical protein
VKEREAGEGKGEGRAENECKKRKEQVTHATLTEPDIEDMAITQQAAQM